VSSDGGFDPAKLVTAHNQKPAQRQQENQPGIRLPQDIGVLYRKAEERSHPSADDANDAGNQQPLEKALYKNTNIFNSAFYFIF
ncbi:hypothetical protein LI291_16700, partial [Intestinibacillus massiliensis]|nr:hypothetical protein [Intestinibacillus massiliensis]